MTFTEAIQEATGDAMSADPRMHVFGLGADYPKGLDGTVGNLASLFPGRVHDIPCSEAAVTGMMVGAAIGGLRPVLFHGRLEFAMYGLDQIVTQAAKWNYMFGGDYPCPVIFRIAIGRQWGNGPQHTQVMHNLFASVPGLRVVVPSSPAMAYALFLAAARESVHPTVIIEHRWLYKTRHTFDARPEFELRTLDRARIIRPGSSITIMSLGSGLLETLRALPGLEANGIDAEVIDLVSLNPIDYDTIQASVEKTRRLLIVDADHRAFGVGREIGHELSTRCHLAKPAQLVNCLPGIPCPTAPSLAQAYYPTRHDILMGALVQTEQSLQAPIEPLTFAELHLPPEDDYDALLMPAPMKVSR